MLVTGLYAESHGIVDNHFYDPVMNAIFDPSQPSSLNSSFWGGEPFWISGTRTHRLSQPLDLFICILSLKRKFLVYFDMDLCLFEVEKANMRSATMFWPGSEVNFSGLMPTYWYFTILFVGKMQTFAQLYFFIC